MMQYRVTEKYVSPLYLFVC